MFNQEYYNERKAKLAQKKQMNLQKLVNATFEFTTEAAYIEETLKEIEQREKEMEAGAVTKEDKKSKK